MNKELIKSLSEHLGARPEAVKKWVESNDEKTILNYSFLIVKPKNLCRILKDIFENNTKQLEQLIKWYNREKAAKNEYYKIEQSKDTSELIINCARLSIRSIIVTFKPAFNELEQQGYDMTKFSKELIESLKTAKVETFDIIEEAQLILSVLKSKDYTKLEYSTSK